MKARSRLKAASEIKTSTPPISKDPLWYSGTHFKTSHPVHLHLFGKLDPGPYLTHLGTLFLGLIFGVSTLVLMHNVAPSSIANWILPHTYLPFQLLLFLSLFFLTSFLWLNSRRGYLTALGLQIPLFLKLQRIAVTWQLVVGILTLFVIIELLFSYLESRNHANFRQNSQTRYRRASP